MAYQAGTATSMAVMTGNPYVIAGAAVFDAYASMTAADAQNEAAEEQRKQMIEGQTLANRADNLAFQQEMERASDENLQQQVAILEAESTAKARDTGVGGTTVDRSMRLFDKKLAETVGNFERSTEQAEQQYKARRKTASHDLTGRINNIEMASYDAVGDLVNTGLVIGGAYQQESNRQKSLSVASGGTQGDSNYSFSKFMGMGG